MIFPLHSYTRHRHREEPGETVTAPATMTQYSGTPSDPWHVYSTYGTSGSVTGWVSEDMYDVESPNWLKIWRSQRIATVNPMESTKVVYQHGKGSYFVRGINRSATQPYYYWGFQHSGQATIGYLDVNHQPSLYFYPTSVPSIDDSIIAEAITECWNKVSMSDAEILVVCGEFSKTISFLVATLRRVWKIYRSLRKLDLLSAAGELHPRELAKRYLEARYALRPMAYDVKKAILALQDRVPARYTTFRHHNSAVVQSENPCIIRDTSEYTMEGSYVNARSLDVRVGVLTAIDALTGSAIRWGAFDIFQSAWELIPFSFIVDWFFNIGKIIGSFSPKVGMKTLASWYVVEDTTYQVMTAETGILKGDYNYEKTYNRTGSYSRTITVRYRVPNPDRPILPTFNVKLNGWKTLDLALIGSALVGLLSKRNSKQVKVNNPAYAWFDHHQSWFND